MTVAMHDMEEFERVSPEGQEKIKRMPRWEADPNYGLRPEGGRGGSAAAQVVAAQRALPAVVVVPVAGSCADRPRGLTQGLEGLARQAALRRAVRYRRQQGRSALPGAARRHPDVIRNHPLLKTMNIGKTGQGGSVGVLITKTLVIVGDPQPTTRGEGATAKRGGYLRASTRRLGRRSARSTCPRRSAVRR